MIERWMRETATLLQGFSYYAPELRPFNELEVTNTSLLVAAAGAAGYYPIAEYAIQKIDKLDRRRRRKGRADLWFVAGDQSYSFEMKRAWNVSSDSQLRRCMEHALADVSEIPREESHYAFGVVIAPVIDSDCLDCYKSFQSADHVFYLESDNNPIVFFYFSESR